MDVRENETHEPEAIEVESSNIGFQENESTNSNAGSTTFSRIGTWTCTIQTTITISVWQVNFHTTHRATQARKVLKIALV